MQIQRRFCASLLAIALLELFPKARLKEVKNSAIDFSLEAYFPYKEFFGLEELLERKMTSLILENREIRSVTMVPVCANAFFATLPYWEERSFKDPLVEIAQIGEFRDPCPLPHLKTTGDILPFSKIIDKELSSSTLKLYGIVAKNKDELKELLKKHREYKKNCHVLKGERADLFFFEGRDLFWLPKGVELQKKLLEFMKKEGLSYKKEVQASTPFSCHFALEDRIVQEVIVNRCYEDFFKGALVQERLFFESLSLKEEEIIEECVSSLEKTTKILRLLNLKGYFTAGNLLLKEALKKMGLPYEEGEADEIRCFSEDGVGRRVLFAFIRLKGKSRSDKTENVFRMERMTFGPLYQTLALLLDKKLPFWLTPEQVRLFTLDAKASKVLSLQKMLEDKGIRVTIDASKDFIKQKKEKAFFNEVPMIAFFDKESIVYQEGAKRSRLDLENFLTLFNRKETIET